MIAAFSDLREDVAVTLPLDTGWEVASTPEARDSSTFGSLRFAPANVPGTIASALRDQKFWKMGAHIRFDAAEHWFRCRFDIDSAESGEELVLRLGGIATVAQVFLNGEKILRSNSMFASHELDVTALVRDHNELVIVCRSLCSAMREKRRQLPVARWKTRVVAEQQLRWFRTTLLGRAPGFAPEPEPVGPWRPVSLMRRRRMVIEDWRREVELDGSRGTIRVQLRVRSIEPGARPAGGRLKVGDAEGPVEFEDHGDVDLGRASISIPNVLCWWPHTHGRPALYPVQLELRLADGSTVMLDDLPCGFRSIQTGGEPDSDGGIALRINGMSIFCRGVVWTPPDVVSLNASPEVLRQRLQLLRDGGFNLIRLAGTTIYESEDFHRLCDELGLLVWQDMMFANMDYPFEDSTFLETVHAEAEAELSRLARHPSTAVLCGNSEIEQQVGMLGLDPAIGRGSFFGDELPRIAAKCCPHVPYIPSAPCGGDQPFRTRTGVANYFGVGAYLRPIEDVRRAEVRFASECLAFSNVPEPELIDKIALATPGGVSPTHPTWKRTVPRDSGAGWDFEDVRDHYLKLLYSVDAAALRYADSHRYWELSRMVSGEVMAEVFGEWRRAASPCHGGIILWSADLEPGAGWGILDSQGHPKATYWFLKRALSPCAIWMTDEGLNGVDIHVANDLLTAPDAWLRVALYRNGELKIAESECAITVPKNTTLSFGVEEILGRFFDAACAYRFGPPGHDLIAASLHRERGDIPLAQAFRFPTGRSAERRPIAELGVMAESRMLDEGNMELLVSSRCFAYGVKAAAPGWMPDDAYFGIEPGVKRRVTLRSLPSVEVPASIVVTAINAEGRLPVAVMRTP
jgi:beta-mannosidase